MYASAGIPEYWILNLVDRRLEVYRNLEGKAYRTHVTCAAEDTVAPLAAPEARISIGSVLL